MRLGIISDIHEDIIRLREAIALIDREGCDAIACLGDIAGFSIPSFGHVEERNASACLHLVRERCEFIVAGNHDLYPARRVPRHTAGFEYPDNWYSMDYMERKRLAGEEVWLNEENELDPLLSKEERDYLGSLPEYQVVREGNVRLFLSHYLYPDLSGSSRIYYEAFGPAEDHLAFMAGKGCLVGFSGHKHVEGCIQFHGGGMVHRTFGDLELERELQWIVGPCVANGKKENGCMIFDTQTFLLNVLPLRTPPRVMQVTGYQKEKDEA